MDIFNDKRVVMTLDAGGTNFVFSAIKSGREVAGPQQYPSNGNDLNLCLKTILDGFNKIASKLIEPAAAISFAFPGPANYPAGIIGDLTNLPSFRGGVALGPMLQQYFKIPVFINNDGDLFAYGEALAGILPELNKKLKNSGADKQYKNLIGLTLGTGFGGGIVRNKELFIGDNSVAGEVWALSNRIDPKINAEEGISTRAVVNDYFRFSGLSQKKEIMPKDIFDIATSKVAGDAASAQKSFQRLGTFLGDIIANLMTLLDGVVVVGGGLTGASSLYMPAVIKELNNVFIAPSGTKVSRLVQQVFNLDDPNEEAKFLKSSSKKIQIPLSEHYISYDASPRLAVATSKLGASRAIALGAYAFALHELER